MCESVRVNKSLSNVNCHTLLIYNKCVEQSLSKKINLSQFNRSYTNPPSEQMLMPEQV
jgi:hypothetical protein